MAKKPTKKKKPTDTNEVLFLRIDPVLAAWLGKLAKSSGRSRNELGVAALEEFRDAVTRASRLRPDQIEHLPDVFVSVVGPHWASRLAALGLLSDELSEAWGEWLFESQIARAESAADASCFNAEGRK